MRLNKLPEKQSGRGVTQHLSTNGPKKKKKKRKNDRCSFCSEMKRLMNPSSGGRCCCTKSICPLREEKERPALLFVGAFFPHDIFREMVPGPLRLLFCYKSNSNNPVCVPAALVFHPQQMCLQACVNHDGWVLAVLLGSC